ncbi:lysosomal amino acid transporter 1 homolog isoform X4 [Cyanistes caeruleus]|nr:lysosomal amino acid transporter 1 homolog isoform X4 [Cyanistes caeruleus]
MDQALSIYFLLGWLGGDLLNLIGSFLADQLPLQVYTAIYYVLADLGMLSLYCYYRVKNRGRAFPAPINSAFLFLSLGSLASLSLLGRASTQEPAAFKGRSLLSAPGDELGTKVYPKQESGTKLIYSDFTQAGQDGATQSFTHPHPPQEGLGVAEAPPEVPIPPQPPLQPCPCARRSAEPNVQAEKAEQEQPAPRETENLSSSLQLQGRLVLGQNPETAAQFQCSLGNPILSQPMSLPQALGQLCPPAGVWVRPSSREQSKLEHIN